MANIPDISDLDLDGKIQMGKQINWGGYSDIFQGVLLLDGMSIEVAIKALRIRQANDIASVEERLRKRFYREVLLWRRLQHPNVVPLLGYVMLPDGPPTLVSPWYVNGNVAHYLKTHPNPDRNTLALDIARGIEYLHSIPVSHGDLKPENVLVNDEGRASLCDFGMSQFIEETSRLTGFTTAGGNLGGTDRFMCPELYDDEPKNSATDMWALGCLVAQILTDEIPYKHITKRHGLPRAIIQGELPMTNDNGLIDSTMWECLARCWSFTPSDRPSAGELASRLIHPSSSAKITAFSRLFSIRSPFFSEPSIELSPDGRYLASACDGGVVRVWVVRNNQLIHFKSWKWPIRGAIHRVTWGRQYYLCIETSLSKVAGHVETGEVFWMDDRDPIVTFTPDGNTLVFIDTHHSVLFMNPQTSVLMSKVVLRQGARCLAFTSGNKRLLVANAHYQTLFVYDVETGDIESTVSLPSDKCCTIAISKDDNFALLSYDTFEPQVWSMSVVDRDGKPQLSLLHQYSSPVTKISHCTKVQFGGLNDQLVVALCGIDTMCIWDRATATILHSFLIAQHHQSGDMSFRWNSDDPNQIVLAVSTWTYTQLPDSQNLEIWSASSSEKAPESGPSDPNMIKTQIGYS